MSVHRSCDFNMFKTADSSFMVNDYVSTLPSIRRNKIDMIGSMVMNKKLKKHNRITELELA